MFWETSVFDAMSDIDKRIHDVNSILMTKRKIAHRNIESTICNLIKSTKALRVYRSDINEIVAEMSFPIEDSTIISDVIGTVREINIILNDPEIKSEITELLVNRALLISR